MYNYTGEGNVHVSFHIFSFLAATRVMSGKQFASGYIQKSKPAPTLASLLTSDTSVPQSNPPLQPPSQNDVGHSVKCVQMESFDEAATSVNSQKDSLANVETQRNSYDCGVHAIANATELALGRDPVVCRWDGGRMREHLKTCLEEGVMKSFPTLGKKRVPFGSRVRNTVLERLYCTCRMPNDKTRPMISCDNCHGWFHNDCVNLANEESCSDMKWSCMKCKQFFEKLSKQKNT